MIKRKIEAIAASKTNCLQYWKSVRDSGGPIGIIRGPEDDLISFIYAVRGSKSAYEVNVLADDFIRLLPQAERAAAIAFLKSKRVRIDDEGVDGDPPAMNRATIRVAAGVPANRTNCLAYWRRIQGGRVAFKLQRGVEDDAIAFGPLAVFVEEFIGLLPEDEREEAIAFLQRRGANFDAEGARRAVGK